MKEVMQIFLYFLIVIKHNYGYRMQSVEAVEESNKRPYY